MFPALFRAGRISLYRGAREVQAFGGVVMRPSVEMPPADRQTEHYLFGGYAAVPIGLAFMVVAFLMVTWPEHWQTAFFRVAAALPVFAVAIVIATFVRRRYARENETDQLHETKSGVAVVKFVVGSLLLFSCSGRFGTSNG